MQTVSIIGVGKFGKSLAEKLKGSYHLKGTTTTPEKLALTGIEMHLLSAPDLPSQEVLSADALILNIPPFEGQAEWFKGWKIGRMTKVVFISSTSVYADTEGLVTETSAVKTGVLSEEETWVRSFADHCILRAGGLFGHGRHPGKSLSGRQGLAGGQHPVNLIHLDDLVRITEIVLTKNVVGTFNVVSDDHPTRKDFYQGYCRKMGLPLPEFSDADTSRGKLVSNEKLRSDLLEHVPDFFFRQE